MKRKILACAAVAVLAASSASAYTFDPNAASVTVTNYSRADWEAYYNDSRFDSVRVVDFEALGATYGETQLSVGADTDFGRFARDGGVDGSGESVVGNGTQVALREDGLNPSTQFGRYNATPGGKYYLDTNDLSYMQWTINPGADVFFDSLIFVMIDAGDVGSRIGIEINGIEKYFQWENGVDTIPNGITQLVRLDFGGLVSAADLITLGISVWPENDGIGFDDIAMGIFNPPVVPLPAAGWLLVGGIAALGAYGRRRKS